MRENKLRAAWIAIGLLLGGTKISAQPSIIQSPQSETVPVGQHVVLSVVAQGEGNLRYFWIYNGRRLPVRSSTLEFTATRRRVGNYRVIVRDDTGQGAASTPAHIAVTTGPAIIAQPHDTTVHEHGTAVFQVQLNSTGPFKTIVWHNENPLEGPHQIPDGLGFNVHSTRLEIPNCLNADNYNGLYWIAVTNDSGGTVSRKARLTVVP